MTRHDCGAAPIWGKPSGRDRAILAHDVLRQARSGIPDHRIAQSAGIQPRQVFLILQAFDLVGQDVSVHAGRVLL